MENFENKNNLTAIQIKQNSLEAEVNIEQMSPGDQPSGCGYCKKDGKKNKQYYSFGFSSEKYTPEMYERIMFLGWRRCGDYIYRPMLEKNCCKMYSIRLDVSRIKLNKNQKKVIRNFKQYLIGKFSKGDGEKAAKGDEDKMQIDVESDKQNKSNKFSNNLLIELLIKFLNGENLKNYLFKELNFNEEDYLNFTKDPNFVKLFPCKNKSQGEFCSTVLITIFNKFKLTLQQSNLDSSKFYQQMHLKFINFLNSFDNKNDFETNISEKTGHLNFKFSDKLTLDKYGLSLLNVSTADVNEKNSNKNKQQKEEKKKEDPYCCCPLECFYNEPIIYESEVKNTYTLELDLNSNLTDEKFNLYKKYQKNVHNDKESELTKSRYQDSWGTSNLLSNAEFDFKNLKGKLSNDQLKLLPKKYGTYDLIHRINGKLIAVGILDIMPQSVSSVYLYYDTDYNFLNVGVLTAIKEIEYTLFLQKYLSNTVNYYVMGFYIHDCQKMKYKGDYFPSEILCPKTLKFYPLDNEKVQKILNEKRNDPLSDEDPIHPNLNLKDDQLNNIIKESSIYYNNQKFNLFEFITDMITESYVDTFWTMIRTFIKHYGPENLEKTKLTI